MDIFYRLGDKLYVNVTNQCQCDCRFCIRNNGDSVGNAGNLWLEHEPSMEEIKAAFDEVDLALYDEIVFCGYGEPLMRLDEVLQTCDYIRSKTKLPIRINTNGLADITYGKSVAPLLKGRVDTVSISLNAANAKDYVYVTRPSFGEDAFDAMLAFAKNCRDYVDRVMFTVVDVISPAEIEASRQIAETVGVELRIRKYEG